MADQLVVGVSEGNKTAVTGLAQGSGRGMLAESTAGIGLEGLSINAQAAGVLGTGKIGVEGKGLGVGGGGVIGVMGRMFADQDHFGFLAGADPQFNQNVGVYGQSNQQGVMGLTTVPKGTGVYGGGTTAAGGDQIGVRGETQSGVGVQGVSFGEGVALQAQSHGSDQGLAGRFIGNVHVQGNPGTSSGDLRVEGTSSFGGDVTCDGDASVAGTIKNQALEKRLQFVETFIARTRPDFDLNLLPLLEITFVTPGRVGVRGSNILRDGFTTVDFIAVDNPSRNTSTPVTISNGKFEDFANLRPEPQHYRVQFFAGSFFSNVVEIHT